jgi:predicted extracellular nuclease
MRLTRKLRLLSAAALLLLIGTMAQADTLRITEWMYSGLGASGKGEFVEFTNMGSTDVDMTGWSYSDNAQTPGAVDLSAFGVVGTGKSVILAEASAAAFKNEWSLAETVKVIGDNTANLGRSDEINLYDATNTLIDRLTFNDQGGMGPRTQNRSGNPMSLASLGVNNANLWVLATNGDRYGSHVSATGDTANPGTYVDVPEPSTMTLLIVLGMAGLIGLAWNRRG